MSNGGRRSSAGPGAEKKKSAGDWPNSPPRPQPATHPGRGRGPAAPATQAAAGWAQPWKAPAYIGPSRPCMCAITLCSAWPTSRGRVRNATTTASTRRTTSSIGRAPLAGGRYAGRAHRVAPGRVGVGLAGFLGAGPRLRDTGGEDELLAQGVPLELGRQEQRGQAGMAGEVDAEHLVRLPLVP